MCYYLDKTSERLTEREAAIIMAHNDKLFREYAKTGDITLLDKVEHIIRVKNDS